MLYALFTLLTASLLNILLHQHAASVISQFMKSGKILCMPNLSLSDPAFEGAYFKAVKSYGNSIRPFCLRCHAPTVMKTKDYELKDPLTKEGITCDFCHTISGINLKNEPYGMDDKSIYNLSLGRKKFGPYKKDTSPAHETEFSEVYTKSEFCAGCHELKPNTGALILGTYSENKINLHDLQGGHSQEQLKKAVNIKLSQFQREKDKNKTFCINHKYR